ncbi:MAG: hypothetical protein RJQ14_25295 [Marinoscillum sp.]
MKRFLLICICLSGYFTVKAQSAGDSLYQSGEYFRAALAYEKEYFFSTNSELRDEILLKKAYAYKALGEYSKAFDVTSRIRIGYDSVHRLVLYERILLAYLAKEYQKSYNELLKWQVKYGADTEMILPLRFLTYVQVNKLEDAMILMEKYATELSLNEDDVEGFLERKWKIKDPERAYNLSLVLPGVGQMYAGHFFKGVFSGLTQTGLVAFTAWSLYTGYFYSGGMTGAALFSTFYLGGARYAKTLTIEHNKQVRSKISNKFLTLITKKEEAKL